MGFLGNFFVDVESLIFHAGALSQYGDKATGIEKTLQQAIVGLEDAFGTDATGQTLAAKYKPAAETALRNLGALPAELADVAGKFADTGKDYQNAEQVNVHKLGGETAV
jgi:hypothetical protein